MTNTTDLLADYDMWRAARSDISERDDSHGDVSSSAWQASDDAALDLLEQAITVLRQPIKVWTCSVQTPEYPPAHATTVHATEDECFEALRDNFDPEGEADDEPPVAIVGHLEDAGYVINIDVQEMTR